MWGVEEEIGLGENLELTPTDDKMKSEDEPELTEEKDEQDNNNNEA